MIRWRAVALAGACLLITWQASAEPAPAGLVRRTVLALYDSTSASSPRFTNVHAFAEMPLNHLGLVVRYHDIQDGFPPLGDLADVRGVLTWFARDSMPDPGGYLQWIDRVVGSGRPLVVIGLLGATNDDRGVPTPPDEIARVLAKLGWRNDGGWLTTTYGARFDVGDAGLFGFERPLPTVVPPYAQVRATAPDAQVALRVAIDGRAGTESDLVIVTPRGSYVAADFACFIDTGSAQEFRQWYIDPFEFFRRAFRTDDVPKPDTATLSGRRIYYSHVDGDGWRNLTQLEPYHARYAMSARVVLEEIVRTHPDFPVSVGPVVGDLDPAWFGSAQTLAIARELFALPQVEASIHTYSHPLVWSTFDETTTQDRGISERGPTVGSDVTHKDLERDARSYDVRPFSLTGEIDDAVAFVETLLPAGKRVGLLQWSGDTMAFERAIAHARERGLTNINGGDTRFDREYPSAAWVAPLGTRVGRELQVYASNSNENTYTDLWRDRFFGFSFLTTTVRNTGAPRRLKPFNIYYHMYSGERLSSLNAVLANLTYARSLSLTPIETSRFSRIVEGFYTATLEQTGTRMWRVSNRGALQTIRFDGVDGDAVDFARSRGVVGQRRELGSLYVALDEADAAPVVALKRVGGAEPLDDVAYLIESRWRVFNIRRTARSVDYTTVGYGQGESVWSWPFSSRAEVRWRAASGAAGVLQATRAEDGRLTFRLPQLTGERVDVTIVPQGDGPGAR